MKLSRNAITMLMAHYRSIYKKAISASLAALVVTSMGVANANATDLPDGDDFLIQAGEDTKEYTLTSTTEHKYKSFTSEKGSTATFSGSADLGTGINEGRIFVSGDININGTLTLKASGEDGKKKRVGLFGAADDKFNYVSTVTLGEESALTLTGSAIESKNVVINGGTHSISGKYVENTGWGNAAHILAYNGTLTINDGDIKLEDGYMDAGGNGAAVNILGGSISMNGSSNEGRPTFIGTYGNHEDHKVTIQDATIVVGNKDELESAQLVDPAPSTTYYGNIFGSNIEIKGDSTIEVKDKGNLTLDGNLITTNQESEPEAIGHTASSISMAGGKIVNDGNLTIGSEQETTFNATAGSITNTGTLNISGAATIGDNVVLANASEEKGGTISVTGSLDIGAKNLENTIKAVDAEGAQKGQLNIETNGKLSVSGEGTLNLGNVEFTGKTGTAGKITFKGAGTLNAQDMTATFSGDSLDTKSVQLTVDVLDITRKTKNTAVTLSGSITVGSDISLKNPEASEASLFKETDGENANTINVNGTLTLGIEGKSGGSLAYDLKLAGNGSTLAIDKGSWTIQSVSVSANKADALSIASGSSAQIADLTITDAVKQDDYVKVDGDLSITKSLSNNSEKAITVDNGGSVSLSNEVLIDTKTGKLKTGLGTFDVGAGSELVVDLGSDKTVGEGEGQINVGSLLASGSNGFINVGDAKLDIKVDENGFVTYDDLKKVMDYQGNVTDDKLKTVSLYIDKNTDVSKKLKGSIGNILIDKDNSSSLAPKVRAVITNNTLGITGDTVLNTPYDFNGQNYYAAITSGDKPNLKLEGALGIKIKNGASLTVGSKGTQGYIGTIANDSTASKSGSLAINGDVTVVEAGQKPTINSSGVVTNLGDIGASANTLKEVNVVGSLKAGNIYTESFKASGNVEATSLEAKLEITSGLTKVGTFTAKDGSQSIQGGELQADKIDLSKVTTGEDKSFLIGKEFKAESPVSLGADSAFVITANLTSPTNIALNVKDGGALALVQGATKDSATVLTDDIVSETKSIIAEAKSAMGEANSVLYVGKKLTSSSELAGGITVGNTTDAGANSLSVGSDSLTVIDVDKNVAGAVIDGTVKVGAEAKLYVKDINVGNTLATNIEREGDKSGWAGANLEFAYGGLSLDENNKVVYDSTLTAQRYGKATAGELAYLTEVTKALVRADEYSNYDSETDFDLGDDYLQALMQTFGSNGDAVVAHMSSVGRFAQLAGIETAAMAITNSGNNALAQRLGVAGVDSAQLATIETLSGASLWVAPTYSSVDADGFAAGAFNYGQDLDLGGVVLGADYLTESGVRIGAMFNIGSGSSDSQGDLVYTENDFDYYGFSIYAGAKFGNFGLNADIGYTTISNDVDQRNIEQFKADIDSSVVTAGLNGQYTFDLGVMDVIPHVGIRYNRINVDGYDVRYNDETLMNADDETLNVVQFPVGVTLASEFKTGNLYVKPSLDLSVIPAAGDTDADTDVHFISDFTEGNIAYTTKVFDDVAYSANLGLNAAYGNAQFGVIYNYTGSDNTDNHSVSLLGKYTF